MLLAPREEGITIRRSWHRFKAQLQLSKELADTQDRKETAGVKAGAFLSRIQARAAIRLHPVRRLPRCPRQLQL